MLTIVQRYSLYICSRFYSPCLVTHPNYRTNFEATKVLYLQKKKWLSWYLTGCYLTHKAINKKETKQCTYWIQNKISQTKWYMTAISFDPPFGHTFDHEIIFISPFPLKAKQPTLTPSKRVNIPFWRGTKHGPSIDSHVSFSQYSALELECERHLITKIEAKISGTDPLISLYPFQRILCSPKAILLMVLRVSLYSMNN